jgi:glycerophosphoryl diester phosphodiesterase
MSLPPIIAHRGASHDAPENTLAAARLGWAQGADALECDVQLARDGRLMVIHDPDTKRTAGKKRAVAAASSAELQTLDVGAWKGAAFAGERIPTLDALLATVPAGRRIFIEVKGGTDAVPELVRCLARCTLQPSQVAVIAFDLAVVRLAKKSVPRVEVCWLLERHGATGGPALDAAIAECCAAELDGLDIEARWPVDAAVAQRVRDAGLKLYVWTVDDVATAQALVAAGVDGITTNRPAWLRERLRTRQRPA